MNPGAQTSRPLGELRSELESLARARGFDALGVSDVTLGADVTHFSRWLGAGLHGEMDYMWKHGTRRTQPDVLVPATVRVLSARMTYWPSEGPSEGPSGEPAGARDAFAVFLGVAPLFAPLREHARFRALLAHVGIASGAVGA